jgi:hypothetical protein
MSKKSRKLTGRAACCGCLVAPAGILPVAVRVSIWTGGTGFVSILGNGECHLPLGDGGIISNHFGRRGGVGYEHLVASITKDVRLGVMVASVASVGRISVVCTGVGTAERHVPTATDTLHVAGVEVACRGRMEIDVIRVIVIVGTMHGVGDVQAVGAVSLIVVAEWSVGAVGGIAVVSCTIDAVVVVCALHGGDMAVGTIGVDIMVGLWLDDRAEFSHLRIKMVGIFCCHRARSWSDDREPERGGQRTRSE